MQQSSQHVALITELAVCGDLDDFCGLLDTAECLVASTQLIQALAYLHDQRFVHGDIKCSNCLVAQLKPKLRLKVAGFAKSAKLALAHGCGVSCCRGGEADEGAVPAGIKGCHGTLHYMAPERLAGELCYHASDVWSIALVCFVLRNGKLPFEASSRDEMSEVLALLCEHQEQHQFTALERAVFKRLPAHRPCCHKILQHPEWLALETPRRRSIGAIATAVVNYTGQLPAMVARTKLPLYSRTRSSVDNGDSKWWKEEAAAAEATDVGLSAITRLQQLTIRR